MTTFKANNRISHELADLTLLIVRMSSRAPEWGVWPPINDDLRLLSVLFEISALSSSQFSAFWGWKTLSDSKPPFLSEFRKSASALFLVTCSSPLVRGSQSVVQTNVQKCPFSGVRQGSLVKKSNLIKRLQMCSSRKMDSLIVKLSKNCWFEVALSDFVGPRFGVNLKKSKFSFTIFYPTNRPKILSTYLKIEKNMFWTQSVETCSRGIWGGLATILTL